MLKQIQIGEQVIGDNQPIFIIAEAGVNHNGSVEIAKQLIDVAKASGVDAIKFQSFSPETLVTFEAPMADYQKQAGIKDSQYEMLGKLQLSQDQQKELYGYSKKQGVVFLSTPFDEKSADFLDNLGMPVFKIGSGEITHFPLLLHIAKKEKPIILSTGRSTMDEVKQAVDFIGPHSNHGLILMHCVASYPAKIEESNLRAMAAIRNETNALVGWSDHTLGITASIMAAALGACVIEKHFTLDKNLPGPDHQTSLNPKELAQMVMAVRDVEKALGDGVKKPTQSEKETIAIGRRSIVPDCDIKQGVVITKEMLAVKRPGAGIQPKYLEQVIGKKATRALNRDELITFNDLE